MSTVELIAKNAAELEALVEILESFKIKQTSRIQGEDLAYSKTVFQGLNTPQAILFEISESDYKKHVETLAPFYNEPIKADVIEELEPELRPEPVVEINHRTEPRNAPISAASISAARRPFLESEIPEGQNWYFYSIKTCLQKFLTFSGTASRSEYGPYAITYILLSNYISDRVWLSKPASDADKAELIVWLGPALLIFVALCIPLMAVVARRLRDAGKSPLWVVLSLVPIVNIAFFIYLLIKKSKSPINP